MKLKYKFAIQKIGGKYAAMTVDEDFDKFNGMIKVEKPGMLMIEALANDVTAEELAQIIRNECDCDEDKLMEQVIEFTDELYDNGLLER